MNISKVSGPKSGRALARKDWAIFEYYEDSVKTSCQEHFTKYVIDILQNISCIATIHIITYNYVPRKAAEVSQDNEPIGEDGVLALLMAKRSNDRLTSDWN